MRSLVVLAALAMSCVMVLGEDLPIKMGLWERTVDATNPLGKPITTTTKSCITPATWQRMVANAQKPHDPNCKIDTNKTGNGYTFNATCTMQGGITVETSGNSKITDSEHIVSDSHTVFTMNGQKHETTAHSAGHFVSADCGSVKPNDPEPAGK